MKPRRVLSVATKPFPSGRAYLLVFVLLVGLCSLCSFQGRAQGTIEFGTNVVFNLQFHGGGTTIITRQYTQAGPVVGERLYAGLRLIEAGASGKLFATERQEVYELDTAAGTFTNVPLSRIGPAMAQQGWPTGLGYDWMRNQIILVSLGGEGYIHTYSPATDSWALLTSMDNWDFDNIEYHRPDDAYYGAQNTHISTPSDRVTLRVSRVNRDGTHGASISIPDLPFGVGFNDHEAEIVSIGDYLVLLLEPGRGFYDKGQAKESRIYMIKPATGDVMLTYRKVWAQWPPANTAPTVHIQSPENGATFNQGSTMRLSAAATDAEGYVTRVDFLANGQLIGTGTRTDSPFGPFELHWTPPAGNYALVARARDQEGATTDSQPVNISVISIGSSTFELSFYPLNGLSIATGQVFTRHYSPQGPAENGRLIPGMRVVRAADSNYFGTHWHQVYKIDPVTGGSQTMVVGSGAEALSWPMDVSYDSLRNRVLLVSLGGEGFLYGYSIYSNYWSTIASMQNHDFDSIVYHRALDVTFAYGYDGDLYKLNANGEIVGQIDLPSIGLQVSPGMYQTEMALVGNRIALLVEPDYPREIQAGQESRIYMIDPATGSMELTYRKIWETQPPNTPPTVEIVNPANGARVDVNAPVLLRARATDSDGIVAGVVFYVNGTRVGLGSRDGTNNIYQVQWTPTVPGTYSIYATATDERGAAMDSVPIGIRAGEPESTENIVGIGAPDPEATELSPLVAAFDPAHFIISRSGDQTHSLTVFYSIHGTAINGQDYQGISTSVTIPAGEASADITIIPLPDSIIGGVTPPELMETVGIRLEPSPMMNPLPSYRIDPLRREAAAVIYERQRPAEGALEIAIPGAGFTYHDAVKFLVPAYHPTLDFPLVDYYVDGIKVGSSNVEVDGIPNGGYVIHSFEWAGATAGQHTLQAKAILANGQMLVSSEVPFVVNGIVAHPPTVQITQPADGAVFVAGRPIEVRLAAQDADGEVRRAEILVNGGLLYRLELPSIGSLAFNWTNPPAGRHALTARVTDNSGLIGTSAPVRIVVRETEGASFVTRDLPVTYAPGMPFMVTLHATPPTGTRAYGVEDLPPAGWQVSQITFDGRFDPVTGKVKFGPFTDAQPRTLSYSVRPSTNANSRAVFGGSSSRDGELYPIAGDTFIDTFGPFHPADADQNSSITLVELTAYAAAWKSGDPRTNVFLRADFVTRAGLIWKRGEAYRFDPKAPVPFCWIPLLDPAPTFAAQSMIATTERIVEPWVTPGGSTEVQLMVWPPAGSSSFVIEENVPSGWGVTNVTGGGIFDPGAGQIRWGIFLGNDPHEIRFTLISPGGWSSIGDLSGVISVDGDIQKIAGTARVISRSEETDVRLATARDDSGAVNIELKTPAGQTGVVEVSTDLVHWSDLQSVYAPDGVANVVDPAAGDAQLRFYRFRAD
jgi:hypothetical protein